MHNIFREDKLFQMEIFKYAGNPKIKTDKNKKEKENFYFIFIVNYILTYKEH